MYIGEQRLSLDGISVNQETEKVPSSSLFYYFNYINSFPFCQNSTVITNNLTIMIRIQNYFVALVHVERSVTTEAKRLQSECFKNIELAGQPS